VFNISTTFFGIFHHHKLFINTFKLALLSFSHRFVQRLTFNAHRKFILLFPPSFHILQHTTSSVRCWKFFFPYFVSFYFLFSILSTERTKFLIIFYHHLRMTGDEASDRCRRPLSKFLISTNVVEKRLTERKNHYPLSNDSQQIHIRSLSYSAVLQWSIAHDDKE
jgi:hypothetical protein